MYKTLKYITVYTVKQTKLIFFFFVKHFELRFWILNRMKWSNLVTDVESVANSTTKKHKNWSSSCQVLRLDGRQQAAEGFEIQGCRLLVST